MYYLNMDKRYYLGIFFLFVQIMIILRNYIIGYNYYFWFCDFAPILLSIAFFMGNKDIVKSIINFGLIPQIIFLIDFIYALNMDTSPIGIITHLSKFTTLSILSTGLIHLTTVTALLLTLRHRPNKKTLLYSIALMFIIYLVTLTFTPANGYINFVYSTGKLFNSFNFTIPNIVWFWPIITFLFIILPTQGIQYILYKFFKKNFDS